MKELESVFDNIKPASRGQEKLKEALASGRATIVGVFGPTGTGKSYLSIAYGLQELARGRYKRLVVAKPIIDVTTGREITLVNNPENYSRLASEYLYDLTVGLAGKDLLDKLISEGKIILADPHLLRGRTFDDSIIFLDDAQNARPEAIVEAITRLGMRSRLVIAGDPVFQRGPHREGIRLARELLLGEDDAEVVDLGVKDIVRPGAKRGIRLLLELQVRKRSLTPREEEILNVAKRTAPDADIITVVDLLELKKKWRIESPHVPDILIIVKEKHLGRVIGQGGERINRIEEEAGANIRAIPLTLDFKEYIRAFHPVAWIHKHILDFDFAGPELRIVIEKGYLGPMLGQGGSYIRFIDEVFNELFGVSVYVVESEEKPKRRKRK
ncbi:MAG: PhoH family protein [Desulfurococcales archaeon]|nr:PhoH family protein [Desulfurococcales archaeon]